MDKLLKEFNAYLAVEKGLAKNTVVSYSMDLAKFTSFLDERKRRLGAFKKTDVIDYLEILRGSGASISSV